MVIFGDPPPLNAPPGTPYSVAPLLQELVANPQRWGRIGTYKTKNSAAVAASKLRLGKQYDIPEGDWEFVARPLDSDHPEGQWGVWGRYFGPVGEKVDD